MKRHFWWPKLLPSELRISTRSWRGHAKRGTFNRGSMNVKDGQDSTQKPMAREQPKDNDENIDPVLLAWPPRSARRIVGLRCSKCGSSKHSVRFCSLLFSWSRRYIFSTARIINGQRWPFRNLDQPACVIGSLVGYVTPSQTPSNHATPRSKS